MKKRCRRIAGLLMAIAISVTALLFAPAGAEPLQECHQVTSSFKQTKA